MDVEEVRRRKAAARARHGGAGASPSPSSPRRRRRGAGWRLRQAAAGSPTSRRWRRAARVPRSHVRPLDALTATRRPPGDDGRGHAHAVGHTDARTDRRRPAIATKPHIVADYIPFGVEAARGDGGVLAAPLRRLVARPATPEVIVLHYTAGGTAESAHDLFAADTPNAGELPGVVAHFIVDKDGTIYQELPHWTCAAATRSASTTCPSASSSCRRAARGRSGPTSRSCTARSRSRPACAWSPGCRRSTASHDRDVIGHASADDHRYFKDLAGKPTTTATGSAATPRSSARCSEPCAASRPPQARRRSRYTQSSAFTALSASWNWNSSSSWKPMKKTRSICSWLKR